MSRRAGFIGASVVLGPTSSRARTRSPIRAGLKRLAGVRCRIRGGDPGATLRARTRWLAAERACDPYQAACCLREYRSQLLAYRTKFGTHDERVSRRHFVAMTYECVLAEYIAQFENDCHTYTGYRDDFYVPEEIVAMATDFGGIE